MYDGQPLCSEVMRKARELGFRPAPPYPLCAPKFNLTNQWRMSAFACEIDVLFLGEGVRSAGDFEPFHSIGFHGCQDLVTLPPHEMTALNTRPGKMKGPSPQYLPPEGKALMMGALMFYSRTWQGRSATSRGLPYVCSSDCEPAPAVMWTPNTPTRERPLRPRAKHLPIASIHRMWV